MHYPAKPIKLHVGARLVHKVHMVGTGPGGFKSGSESESEKWMDVNFPYSSVLSKKTNKAADGSEAVDFAADRWGSEHGGRKKTMKMVAEDPSEKEEGGSQRPIGRSKSKSVASQEGGGAAHILTVVRGRETIGTAGAALRRRPLEAWAQGQFRTRPSVPPLVSPPPRRAS